MPTDQSSEAVEKAAPTSGAGSPPDASKDPSNPGIKDPVSVKNVSAAPPEGQSIPIPPAKAEFDTNHSPVITHDLRAIKPEESHPEALADFDPANPDARSMPVTISRAEYDRLKTFEAFRKITIDFEHSEIPADQALEVSEMMDLRAQKASELLRKVNLASPTSNTVTLANIDNQQGPRRSLNKPFLWAAGIFFLAFLPTTAYFAGRVKGEQLLQRASALPEKTTRALGVLFSPVRKELPSCLARTNKEVIWVTTDPNDTFVLDLLQNLKKRRINITIMALGNRLSSYELSNIANTYGFTLLHNPIAVPGAGTNIFLIDNIYTVSVMDSLSIWISSDADDFRKVEGFLRREILPNLRTIRSIASK